MYEALYTYIIYKYYTIYNKIVFFKKDFIEDTEGLEDSDI